MRPLNYVIRSQSLIVLARELLWRTRRKWLSRGLKARLLNPTCPVRYEAVGYYSPNISLCSDWARRLIVSVADRAINGLFPLLSYNFNSEGGAVGWDVDFVSGKSWPQSESDSIATIRYDGSDVKAPWELSRLQMLPVLGKAFLLTESDHYLAAATDIISDWIEKNPVGRGVNWTIAMEASLRAISICFYLDLIKGHVDPQLLQLTTRSLWEHLLFIEAHLEFSHLIRSNHYLSNLLGLCALSVYLHGEGMRYRRERYTRLLQEEILVQVYGDGGDKEASTGYQVLVAQMFTCGALLLKASGDEPDQRFLARLQEMFRCLDYLADGQGCLPHVGDCDDGRVELLLDDLHQILEVPLSARNSLRISSFLELGALLFGDQRHDTRNQEAWYGKRSGFAFPPNTNDRATEGGLQVLPESGIARMRLGKVKALFFAVPNGLGGLGSHTHNDKLSFTLSLEKADVFVDSGTGCYTRDRNLRDAFRSTESHNVLQVDGLEQNTIPTEMNGTFCLGNEARVSRIWGHETKEDIVVGASHSGYERSGVGHSRTLRLSARSLIVEDKITCKGQHHISLYFQVATIWQTMIEEREKRVVLSACGKQLKMLWRTFHPDSIESKRASMSTCYGVLTAGTRIKVNFTVTAPSSIETEILWVNA